MESFEIPLNDHLLEYLQAHEPDIKQFLEKVFIHHTLSYDLLAFSIARKFIVSGDPRVVEMKYDRHRFDTVTLKGSFRVVCKIEFTYGCNDFKNEKKDETSEWSFEIDKERHHAFFYNLIAELSRSRVDED